MGFRVAVGGRVDLSEVGAAGKVHLGRGILGILFNIGLVQPCHEIKTVIRAIIIVDYCQKMTLNNHHITM